jgi:hypothetical protein
MPVILATQEAEIRRIKANSSWDPYLKKPITKNWAGGVAQGEGPEFKPQYHKKKKERKLHGIYFCNNLLILPLFLCIYVIYVCSYIKKIHQVKITTVHK